MHRLHVDSARLGQDRVIVSDEDHRYLVRVLRLGMGDVVVLFDGRGEEAEAEIDRVGPRAIELRVRERRQVARPTGPEMILLQALARGEKTDLVVQKATELGVGRIVPVTSERSELRLGDRASSRRARWQKIAREASRQSGRAHVPEIDPVTSLENALAAAPAGSLKLILWEELRHQRRSLKDALPAVAPPHIVIAVGPEGGFSSMEVERARRAGFIAVGLGPRTLRTETAALATLAVLGFALGDLGG